MAALCLLTLLFPVPTSSDTTGRSCPMNCTCQVTITNLAVQCQDADPLQFEAQLNDLFESIQDANFTDVRVENTPLANLANVDVSHLAATVVHLNLDRNRISPIPPGYLSGFGVLQTLVIDGNRLREVSYEGLRGLHSLKVLSLVNNQISKLDQGAFRDLKGVEKILLSGNEILTLADGLFDGLLLLRDVELDDNLIVEIGDSTFLDLPSIRTVRIRHNPLRTVDVWPLRLLVELDHPVEVLLENNISEFSNRLNWTYNCSMPPARGKLSFEDNNVRHFSDVIYGWASSWNQLSILCLWKTDQFRVSFVGNPLVCDCVDFDVYKVLRISERSVGYLLCYEPAVWRHTSILAHPLSDFVCHLSARCPPGCLCVQRPYNKSLEVDCRGLGLRVLPWALPDAANLTRYRYVLRLQGNALAGLPGRPYFDKVHSADFSYNVISDVDADALATLAQADCRYVYLHANRLSSLPSAIRRVDFAGLTALSLYGNPWSCRCQNSWLSAWLRALGERLVLPEGVLCAEPSWLAGRAVISLNESDFCTDPRRRQRLLIAEIAGATLAAVALLVLVPFGFAYAHRVWIYSRFRWHPFDYDECDGEGKEFDAFFSYCTDDEPWVEPLISELERRGYRIAFHRRDFHGGTPITTNIEMAIDQSKRTVCVVTEAYVRSDICMWEFDTAQSLIVRGSGSRLVVIRSGRLDPDATPRSIYYYLTRFTYIDRDSPHFLDNLLYSLPVQVLGCPEGVPTLRETTTPGGESQRHADEINEGSRLLQA